MDQRHTRRGKVVVWSTVCLLLPLRAMHNEPPRDNTQKKLSTASSWARDRAWRSLQWLYPCLFVRATSRQRPLEIVEPAAVAQPEPPLIFVPVMPAVVHVVGAATQSEPVEPLINEPAPALVLNPTPHVEKMPIALPVVVPASTPPAVVFTDVQLAPPTVEESSPEMNRLVHGRWQKPTALVMVGGIALGVYRWWHSRQHQGHVPTRPEMVLPEDAAPDMAAPVAPAFVVDQPGDAVPRQHVSIAPRSIAHEAIPWRPALRLSGMYQPFPAPRIVISPPPAPMPAGQSTALVPVWSGSVHWASNIHIPSPAPSCIGLVDRTQHQSFDRSTAVVVYKPRANDAQLPDSEDDSSTSDSENGDVGDDDSVMSEVLLHVPPAAAPVVPRLALVVPRPEDHPLCRRAADWLEKIKQMAHRIWGTAHRLVTAIDTERGGNLYANVSDAVWDALGKQVCGECRSDQSFARLYLIMRDYYLVNLCAVPAPETPAGVGVLIRQMQQQGRAIVQTVNDSVIDGYHTMDTERSAKRDYRRVNTIRSALRLLISGLKQLHIDPPTPR